MRAVSGLWPITLHLSLPFNTKCIIFDTCEFLRPPHHQCDFFSCKTYNQTAGTYKITTKKIKNIAKIIQIQNYIRQIITFFKFRLKNKIILLFQLFHGSSLTRLNALYPVYANYMIFLKLVAWTGRFIFPVYSIYSRQRGNKVLWQFVQSWLCSFTADNSTCHHLDERSSHHEISKHLLWGRWSN